MFQVSVKIRLFVVCSLLLAGCSTGAEEDNNTRIPIRVELSPTLQYLTPAIQACTIQANNLSVILEEKPASEMGKTGSDLSLMWGDRLIPEGFEANRLGADRLVLAGHIDNPLEKLAVDQAFFLMRAGFVTWGDALQQLCPDCATPDGFANRPLEVWHYPESEDLYNEISALSVNHPAAEINRTWIAPAPGDLADVITNNPGAIGWLPARWLNSNLKEIIIEGIDPYAQIIPVVAIYRGKQALQIESWLACLQSSYGN